MENGWGNNLVEQVSPEDQLVRIKITPCDSQKPLTRQATIAILQQFDIPYLIGPTGYPLIARRKTDRIESNIYQVTII